MLKQTPPQPVVHLAAILKYIRDLGILEADSACAVGGGTRGVIQPVDPVDVQQFNQEL